jgi:hypothetical protein
MATGKGNTTINNFLKLLLNATTWTGIAVNDTGTPLTNLIMGLSTGTLSAASNQTTTEAAYGSYARVAIARTTGGFTAASAQSSALVATCSFPAASSGTETETYAMLGTDNTASAGVNLYFGPISPNLAVTTGVTPQLTTSTTFTEA